MNYKLLNCLLASCVLSYCPYISQASESVIVEIGSGNEDVKRRLSDEDNINNRKQHSENGSVNNVSNQYGNIDDNDDECNSKEDQVSCGWIENIKKQMNSGPRVEYDPHTMWFDYQALFEKTRNAVLEIKDDIKVEHTEFSENDVARKALFGDSNYEQTLQKILSGDINAQCDVLCSSLYDFFYDHEYDFYDIGFYDRNILLKNYMYYLGLIVSLSNNKSFCEEYEKYASYIPNDLNCFRSFNINYKNVMDSLI
ncbi:MAG: hypothetical protein IJ848_02325 [Alphaproteobacteria bacterium]|nr:hypothetical protein [Alphaproteobacteria bacterium]